MHGALPSGAPEQCREHSNYDYPQGLEYRHSAMLMSRLHVYEVPQLIAQQESDETHQISGWKMRGYEDLERKLKQISMEKSNLLHQLSKTAIELEGIKGNLQSLKSYETVAKNDVQKLLEISQKQKDEMKSLQEALQKQVNEAALKAEKQQAGINFLKAEVERKSKLIKDLQQENKSLKNKLLSGNKQCGIHAEESKKIQSQLKELRYGKKDLIFKAQQLTDLERKLLAVKQELEKTAGDKESQLEALKEVAQLCVSGVLKNQTPFTSIIPPKAAENRKLLLTKNSSKVPFYPTDRKLQDISQTGKKGSTLNEDQKKNDHNLMECDSQNAGKMCPRTEDNKAPLSSDTVEPGSPLQMKTYNSSRYTSGLRTSEENGKIEGM
ncbi:leucine zipper protein 2 [Callorhinchus milii]|uniref:leucine zipper protein 2 n=1 Tax=Callorhinchus milii TaxID=7868 RepID=UPI0004573A05|nr:leucine zipper protein 2 [Callorhinchus milii]|eukprot:gi/632941784/ref/XP_007886052.1/ PREDICTED: leucine zipper protein 2 [Callorhinchus milii]